ncbi:MAG: carbohydrate ABC transporter permease [Armatimonadota bacterium]
MANSQSNRNAINTALHRRKVILRFLGQWPVIVLVILILLTMAPYFFAILISGKSRAQFDFNPFGFTFPFYFDQTYPAAFRVIIRYIFNSVFVSSVSCIGVLILGALVAYLFARFEFPGKEFLFVVILSMLMIPGILTLVPRFVVVYQLGLYKTIWSLIIPYIASGQVMAIFLLRTFFGSISNEFFEAAKIDGANEVNCFLSLALPLSKSILGVVAILQVLGTWNDLFWPYLVVGGIRELMTIPIGLLTFSSDYGEMIGTQMAGYILSSLPLIILFAFTSRQFVAGLTSGGLKL